MQIDPSELQLLRQFIKFLDNHPEIYHDLLGETVTETGKMLGRIPRAINAALMPLDIWIEKREYNLAATKRILAAKLEHIDSEKITTPEPYIAVPAIQAISYAMNDESIRNMYSNLLSKAMFTETKDDVHPVFVDIIKNMSPRDASNLSLFKDKKEFVIANFRLRGKSSYIYIKKDVFIANKDYQDIDNQAVSVSLLEYLGLIKTDFTRWHILDDYADFNKLMGKLNIELPPAPIPKEVARILFKKDDPKEQEKFENQLDTAYEKRSAEIQKGIVEITPLGKAFLEICLTDLP